MPLWTNLFSLLLAIIVVSFNLIVLIATAVQPRLHTISNTLSCNLWLANCFTGIVAVFHNLFYSTVIHVETVLLIPQTIHKNISPEASAMAAANPESYLQALGPQTLAALFNSTVSLLALLAMAFVQIFSKYQNWMPSSAPVRISACLWTVVVLIIFVNFTLVQLTQSLSLIVAFQLALLSIFLVINLIIHPINLLIASKSQQSTYLSKSITQSLWLLLHSLSFTLLAMMLVWESSQPPGSQIQEAENAELINLQLAAYSVHCIANPIIAMLRDQRLLSAISSLVNGKEGRREADYTLIMQQEGTNQWFLPEQWIFRHLPPPPPYMSPAGSLQAINPNSLHIVDCIDSDSELSSDEEGGNRSRPLRSSVIIMNRQISDLPTNL
ncbi:hypothetical protein FO519_003469 [Halicephalobus sp. NKZ332]|nr:hypothetical protein FO519_003469 [Halicephalobus sp. NKZ332]